MFAPGVRVNFTHFCDAYQGVSQPGVLLIRSPRHVRSAGIIWTKRATPPFTSPPTLKCSGMVVEWVTSRLYIVGKTDNSGLILVVNFEKLYLMKHIVTELRRPLNIVVHPQRSKIYWILESHNITSTNMEFSRFTKV